MFHAIATTTVLPSLKSARRYCSEPRPPQFILSSDDPEECHAALVKISGGRECNELALALNGLPVFVTGDWTYFVVRQD